MIEINYVPIYMKINHILFVIKGQKHIILRLLTDLEPIVLDLEPIVR